MRRSRKIVAAFVFTIAAGLYAYKSFENTARSTGVPQAWDDIALADLTVPLASPAHSPKPIPASSYYWIPVRTLYKTYPVYHPDREPAGYMDWLRQQPPEEIWNSAGLKSEADWAAAGKLVFEAPLFAGALGPVSTDYRDSLYLRDKRWHARVQAPISADGTLPFYRYVIEKQGEIRVGVLSCAMCHTRVLENGAVAYGAQGNLPFDRAFAYDYRYGGGEISQQRGMERLLYHAPWRRDDPASLAATTDEIAARHEAIPAGVMARHGSNPEFPVAISDLFGLADRRYLDRTGLQKNRGIGDIMRYAALNQGGDDLSPYGDSSPLSDAIGFSLPAQEKSILESSNLGGHSLGGHSDGNSHSHSNLPILLAGAGGGTLAPGRFIRFSEKPVANLFLSMLDRMGCQGVQSHGDSTGRLQSI